MFPTCLCLHHNNTETTTITASIITPHTPPAIAGIDGSIVIMVSNDIVVVLVIIGFSVDVGGTETTGTET